MKREEWEKTTGKKFSKERRKDRRSVTNMRASIAYDLMIDALKVYRTGIEGKPFIDASARQSNNAALSAILKFGRRFMPLYKAAQRELDRRYEATQHGRKVEHIIAEMSKKIVAGGAIMKVKDRRKELKRAYKRDHR